MLTRRHQPEAKASGYPDEALAGCTPGPRLPGAGAFLGRSSVLCDARQFLEHPADERHIDSYGDRRFPGAGRVSFPAGCGGLAGGFRHASGADHPRDQGRTTAGCCRCATAGTCRTSRRCSPGSAPLSACAAAQRRGHARCAPAVGALGHAVCDSGVRVRRTRWRVKRSPSWAALILITTPQFIISARDSRVDMVFCAFLTLGLMLAWRVYDGAGGRRTAAARRALSRVGDAEQGPAGVGAHGAGLWRHRAVRAAAGGLAGTGHAAGPGGRRCPAGALVPRGDAPSMAGRSCACSCSTKTSAA